MSETLNTSSLFTEVKPIPEDDREVAIEVSDVSMIFNMASQQLNSLKEYVIALSKQNLRFKEFRALSHVNLTVKKGDVFGIMGTNGSGKSTLLKIIAGVLDPSEGTSKINGSIAPLIELGAGFDMELTARENIYLNGALLGYSKDFISENFDAIVSFAEIEKFLDTPLKNYSSGMVARIAFAVATVIVPDILIVDEVLSVGDAMFQQKCERRIQSLIKEHNVTVLIVSHNTDQIERLCNKVIWIEKGNTRVVGAADEVCPLYRMLGGHVGSPESEAKTLEFIEMKVHIPTETITRLNGDDKYDTAVGLCEKLSNLNSIVLAPGESIPHCMLANALASVSNSGILLVKQANVPEVTKRYISQTNPATVYLIGDDLLISSSCQKEIQKCCKNSKLIRIFNGDLQKLSTEIFSLFIPNWSDTAIISYPECTGDMISLLPYMGAQKMPLILADAPDGITTETSLSISNNKIKKVYILGSESQFSNENLSSLVYSGIEVERIVGKNAYFANILINELISADSTMNKFRTAKCAVMSSFWHPAFVLAIGPYVTREQIPIILADSENLDSTAIALEYLHKNKNHFTTIAYCGNDAQFNHFDRELFAKAII